MNAELSRSPLMPQLAWFIRLRWVAGSIVIIAGVADWLWIHFDPHPLAILAIGLCILIYNAFMLVIFVRSEQPRLLLRLAVLQMILDLIALALLVGLTGGIRSPILTLFILHMVFASLLLPRWMAYTSSIAAVILLAAALILTKEPPARLVDILDFAGLAITLVLAVMLTSRITRDLRRKRRRLMRQNRRIRALVRSLRQGQRTMIRQEKMVALGQMATGVAHEITNPLASMDSLLQLAERNPEKMDAAFITKLRNQVSRINATIHQMRSLAHPSPGERQRLPLNDLVTQASDLLHMNSRARRMNIERDLGADVGWVIVQPQAIVQVVINLLLNALDATAEMAEPKIAIRTRRGEKGYLIEVSDNGIGIQPHHITRVFEPFFTTKPVGQGTGLGLSISFNLIRRQGGQMDVSSIPGTGTVFTIQLPAAASEKSHVNATSSAQRSTPVPDVQ